MIIYKLLIDNDIKKIFVHVESSTSMIKKWDAGIKPTDLFKCNGQKKSDGWNPPNICWFDDNNRDIARYKDPDVSYIGPSRLIVSSHASELIKPAIDNVAELLPVMANDEIWYFLNIFNEVDALDEVNSEYKIYENGDRGFITKLALLPKKIPHAKLFMLPNMSTRIFYAEHQPDNNPNTLKNIIEKNNLTGIQLKKYLEY